MVSAPRLVRPSARGVVAPFLKWAGGKRQLVPELLRMAPRKFGTYFEPFLGGGALFFALRRERRFRRAVLGDQNRELIICYQAIQGDVAAVIRELRQLPPTEDDYYRIRELEPESLGLPARAARTIYLNKVGYNGLYRVNSSGRFNVPFGRYKRPRICDEERLESVAAALGDQVELVYQDFQRTAAAADRADFVYFDPPYVPLSPTASFTAYAQGRFGPAEQARLAEVLRELGTNKIRAVLSNSDCKESRRLYKGLPRKEVEVRRPINSVATRRGPVGELLVKSFPF